MPVTEQQFDIDKLNIDPDLTKWLPPNAKPTSLRNLFTHSASDHLPNTDHHTLPGLNYMMQAGYGPEAQHLVADIRAYFAGRCGKSGVDMLHMLYLDQPESLYREAFSYAYDEGHPPVITVPWCYIKKHEVRHGLLVARWVDQQRRWEVSTHS